MVNRNKINVRDKLARTSSRYVYYVDESGNKVRVDALDFGEGNRPKKEVKYCCLSCDQEMVFHIGKKLPNQPDTLDGSLLRSPSAFQHKPGTLETHINTEADSIAYDLAKFIREFAQQKKWVVSERQGSAADTWVILISAKDTKGTVRTIPFVISPNLTHELTDNPEAVIITSTTGQAGDRRRLILYDDKYNPLSSQQVKDAVVEMDPKRLFVSGYFAFNPRGLTDSKNIFLPRQIKLTQALADIMEGNKVFVEGVDAIANKKFQTNAKYALVDQEQYRRVTNLIEESHPTVKRRAVAGEIAYKLGLSIYSDKSTVKSTNKFRFGGGEILFVFPGMKNNEQGKFRPEDHKILVNPSPVLMMRILDPQDWKNTMVLFVNDKDRGEQFYYRVKQFLEHNPGLNLQIRNTSTIDRAVKYAKEFLSLELAKRAQDLDRSKEINQPALWDELSSKVFLDHETGVGVKPEPPIRRLPYDPVEFENNILK